MEPDIKQTIIDKGWTIKQVAERWNYSVRRVQQWIKDDDQRTRDAVRGLPHMEED